MKIIREGDLSRITAARRFTCPDCNCLFEASGYEYLRTQINGRIVCECNCPTCRKLVRIDDEQ